MRQSLRPSPARELRWSWPTRGKLLHAYSPAKPGGKGIDIGGRPGQAIRAAAPGRVVYAGSGLRQYGKLIIIKHNENLLSAYGHNQMLHVHEGDQVKGGQHIADMGTKGNRKALLHFEIRYDGKPENPLRYLPATH